MIKLLLFLSSPPATPLLPSSSYAKGHVFICFCILVRKVVLVFLVFCMMVSVGQEQVGSGGTEGKSCSGSSDPKNHSVCLGPSLSHEEQFRKIKWYPLVLLVFCKWEK